MSEAFAAGLDFYDLRAAVRQGQLVRIKHGWYVTREKRFPRDLHALRVQMELRDNKRTVASHYSGAILLGLPVHQVDWATVHLMTLDDVESRRRPGLRLHQRLADGNPTRPDCVSVALACAQTALLDPLSGLMAADHALRQEHMTRADLDRALAEVRGMRGYRSARSTLDLVSSARQSPKESHLAFALNVLGFEFEEQVEITTRFGVTRPDFRIRGTWVLVEYDGEGKYAAPDALVKEKRREDALRTLGYDFVRVTKDILDDLPTLDAQIRDKLRRTALSRKVG